MYNTDMPTRAELPTSRQLLRSTVLAIIAAAVILVTIVLPAEYAIDPTGIGRVLRLTEMGEIKAQLAEEAAKDRALDQQNQPPASAPKPNIGSSLLDRIIAEFLVGSARAQTVERNDEIKVTLKSGEGTEVKLAMRKGAKAKYSWIVAGGVVNFDLHGDAKGKETSYEKGRGVSKSEGVLEAGFDGAHGWFWRNRGQGQVTITLRTNGEYSEIKRIK